MKLAKVMSNTTNWYLLPQEIRRMILEVLIKEESSISCYAPVCREWQRVIEQTTFHQLRLTPSRLSELYKIAYSRRCYLECIKFYIRLQEYDCSQCDKVETEDWRETDVNIVETALRDLFHTLSTWQPSDRHLTLDISISSPSDVKHYFKSCYFDDINCLVDKTLLTNDPRHGWRDGQQVTLPPSQALGRVFGFIELSEEFWLALPQVVAITCVQVRRQNHRQFEPKTLSRLLSFLPTLQTICYEPWREWTRAEQHEADESLQILLQSLNLARLRRLIIFEDFEDSYLSIRPQVNLYLMHPYPIRMGHRAVGGALAQSSLMLESLSVSFLIEASHFFSVCQPSWAWHNLNSLALTSRHLVPGNTECAKINVLLQSAARFAMNSPKLMTLILWNYNSSYVCAFSFQASQVIHWAKITWRATWMTVLEPATIKLWEAVALKRGSSELLVVMEELDARAAPHSRGDAINSLQLPVEVIHAQSLRQILEESRY